VAQVVQIALTPSGVGRVTGFGSLVRISLNSCFSQPCWTTFVQLVTPFVRSSPSAGWNNVNNLAVPFRMYSCGWRWGCPRHSQLCPGYPELRETLTAAAVEGEEFTADVVLFAASALAVVCRPGRRAFDRVGASLAWGVWRSGWCRAGR
jgi:hypothetical protein